MPFCTSTAQRTASTTLRNSMRMPSPVRLTTRPLMHRDGWIEQIAPERPQPRQRAILVGASETAVSDYIRRQDRREFPGLGHDVPSAAPKQTSRKTRSPQTHQHRKLTPSVSDSLLLALRDLPDPSAEWSLFTSLNGLVANDPEFGHRHARTGFARNRAPWPCQPRHSPADPGLHPAASARTLRLGIQ